jgi:hypothetical protein
MSWNLMVDVKIISDVYDSILAKVKLRILAVA